MKKMTRNEVYDILNIERDYQDKKWGNINIENDSKSVSDILLFMRKYLNDAENAVYNSNCEEAMTAIKKVTALGVVIMELKGCPEKKEKND